MEMTKREYAEKIAEIIGAEVKEVEKNNGVSFTGLTKITEGANIAPTIYIEKFYEEGKSVEEAAEMIETIMEKENININNFDADKLMDWETVKDQLSARLLNKTTNAEVKRDASPYGFEELIIVPVINVSINEGKGSIKVTSRMLDMWKKSPKEVIDTALENVKEDYEIKGMTEMIMDMSGIPEEDREAFKAIYGCEDEKMFVLSNKMKCYGAIAVISAKAREELEKRFPNGYVVLPSSIHEVLIVPIEDEVRESELTAMVQEVNGTQVAPEERLADRAFYFADFVA